MLLIQGKAKESEIAGIGLFATEFIGKGTVIWKFDPKVDTAAVLADKNQLFYGYVSKQTGRVITPGDDARHINHSDTPNVGTRFEDGVEEDVNFALQDISPGDEITIDYRTFAQEGVDFK